MFTVSSFDTSKNTYKLLGEGRDAIFPACFDDMFVESMFTHRSYLQAQNQKNASIAVQEYGAPALFSNNSGFFVHLGRVNNLSGSQIQSLSQDLFRSSDADFIIFEDVHVTSGQNDVAFPIHCFCYQGNWRLPVGAGNKYVSSKRARNLRWCRKKLAEPLGSVELEYRFGKCLPDEVAAVAALNRDKILQSGGHHYLTDNKLALLTRVCADIGYSSCLYADGKIVAGNIVCVSGKRAFGILTGYDNRFEKFSPGLQVTLSAVQELEGMGCEEINFLWGDSPWKSSFHSTRDPLTTVIVRRSQRVLFSASYWKQVAPYLKHALKAFLKPHVMKGLNEMRRFADFAKRREAH